MYNGSGMLSDFERKFLMFGWLSEFVPIRLWQAISIIVKLHLDEPWSKETHDVVRSISRANCLSGNQYDVNELSCNCLMTRLFR